MVDTTKPLRVLIVEDEESFLEALRIGLGREGFAIDVARDGAEALERFEAVTPDIVLLDVMLPGMDGYEVLQQLKAAEVDTPVILQSALVERDEAVKGLSLGVADYLIKPFTKPQLTVRLNLVQERLKAEEEEEAVKALEAVPAFSSEVTLQPAREAPQPVAQPGGQPATEGAPEVTAREVLDRRDSNRSNVLRGGQIVYRAATCTMECVVLNLSDEGAALQPADTPHCPDVFTLKIHHGPTYRCEVCWRYRNKLGVRFV